MPATFEARKKLIDTLKKIQEKKQVQENQRAQENQRKLLERKKAMLLKIKEAHKNVLKKIPQ